jgi:drug/metabolite transporter (DMT)-like permease
MIILFNDFSLAGLIMDINSKKLTNNFTNLKFIIMMSITVIVWAFAFPFIKIGLEELSFVNLTIMRFLIVCVVFILLIGIKSKSFSKLNKKDILPIFLLGFFGVIVYHLGLNFGEQYISAGAASLIIATIPIQIVILAVIFLNEKITFKKLIGIIIALIGVVIISIWGKSEEGLEIQYIYGALAVLISALMGAIYTIAGKKMLKRYNAISLTVYAMLLGSLGLIPFISNSLFQEVNSLSATGWFAILFLGVFSTVIGYFFWYVGLQIKSATDVSVYLYAIPVLSTVISYILFDDRITFMFLFGGVLVITGLAIVNSQLKKQKDKINK